MKYQPLKKQKKTKYDIFKEKAEYVLSIPIDYKTQQGISHSQYEIFFRCPLAWHYQYPKKLVPFQQTIHTCFGTAVHGTIQEYVKTMYLDSVKSADAIDIGELYTEQFKKAYREALTKTKGVHFTTLEEIESFDDDANHILTAIKKDRGVYFPSRNHELVGIELPLNIELEENLFFKGFIDIVIYDARNDLYIIYDLKTSTGGWTAIDKQNRIKTAQMVAYREFFSKQYNIPLEKIKCEYIILRRKVNTDLEFVPKRIQSFEPPIGPKITKQYYANIEAFKEMFINGRYTGVQPEPTPSDSACKFCYFRDKKDYCPSGPK